MLFSLIFPVLIFASCGLPSYSYLYPPSEVYTRDNPGDSSNGQDLIFSNAYQNNLSIFNGYEVYYKIYDPLSGSAARYQNDITSMTATGADFNTLNSLGFRRLFFSTSYTDAASFIHDSSRPAFSPDSSLLNQDYRIRFNLQQDVSPTYLAEPFLSSFTYSSVPYIYRWVYNDSPSGAGTETYTQKQFGLGSFDIYDSDLPSTVSSADLSISDYYFYISYYIMSFGRDTYDITSLVYSVPVYLGTIKFKCSLTDDFY